MNELKTFLEEEKKDYFDTWDYDATTEFWLERHDQRLIQKVVEIVKKEVDSRKMWGDTAEGYERVVRMEDVGTLLNNLTI